LSETVSRHVGFAAHFDLARGRAGQLFREIADRARVRCYVVAHTAVAARCGAHERTVTVQQRYADTVDL